MIEATYNNIGLASDFMIEDMYNNIGLASGFIIEACTTI